MIDTTGNQIRDQRNPDDFDDENMCADCFSNAINMQINNGCSEECNVPRAQCDASGVEATGTGNLHRFYGQRCIEILYVLFLFVIVRCAIRDIM